jgi:hypothetical protein
MAVTHDMAHSFGVVDAVPGKTDEGGESHHARRGTDRRHGVASRRNYVRARSELVGHRRQIRYQQRGLLFRAEAIRRPEQDDRRTNCPARDG